MPKHNNLTPKDDFLAAKYGERHMEIVQDPMFRRACEAAFAQYLLFLPFDPGNAYRIEGARGALNTLLNLGNVKEQSPIFDVPELKPT